MAQYNQKFKTFKRSLIFFAAALNCVWGYLFYIFVSFTHTYSFRKFTMKLHLTLGAAALAAAFTSAAIAGHENIKPHKADSLGRCVKAALAAHEGKIVKLEMKTEDKKLMYEFDIESADGASWDIECSVKTGKITEIEQEVKADDPKFKALAKASEADAKAIALAAHHGKVVETEFELEPDGKVSYEFDIEEADGEEIKVEVDATTGKIVEVSYEVYQIGRE
jgi:uncharacterized membrane protein YkoI